MEYRGPHHGRIQRYSFITATRRRLRLEEMPPPLACLVSTYIGSCSPIIQSSFLLCFIYFIQS